MYIVLLKLIDSGKKALHFLYFDNIKRLVYNMNDLNVLLFSYVISQKSEFLVAGDVLLFLVTKYNKNAPIQRKYSCPR